jgi:ABC-type transport system involved in cytochrome c biogenesis permease subunit
MGTALATQPLLPLRAPGEDLRVAVTLHQLTAAIYLVAGLVAGFGLALPSRRLIRVSVGLFAAAVVAHGAAFAVLHTAEPAPPLTDLPTAVSFMALVGSIFYLLLLRRVRLAGLVSVVAPLTFLSVFGAALRLPNAVPDTTVGSGSWPHGHVLLASAGLAMLGLSGVAGLFFLAEHRRLKRKRPIGPRFPLPSLEALDRVNRIGLAVGFPLLSLGVVTGMMWVHSVNGRLWTGATHETWSAIAWAIYGVLVIARFVAGQGSRQAAASAVGGFAFLLFAVIGVEIFA